MFSSEVLNSLTIAKSDNAIVKLDAYKVIVGRVKGGLSIRYTFFFREDITNPFKIEEIRLSAEDIEMLYNFLLDTKEKLNAQL